MQRHAADPSRAVKAPVREATPPVPDWRAMMHEAALELDADGRITSATCGSQAALKPLVDDRGLYLIDRLRASDRVVFLHAHGRVRAGERRVEIAVSLRLDAAGREWADIAMALVRGPVGAVALLRDTTASALDQPIDAAPAADGRVADAACDPLAELAHELRTPLNAVAGARTRLAWCRRSSSRAR